jgi:hypothetical protein
MIMTTMTTHIIHIEWEGPYTLDSISTLTNAKDFGVYQIYGSHAVYGSHVLLYIGKADRQTFGVRIRQELWQLNKDARAVQVYVGRLAGETTPSMEQWSQEIADAEKLLIYAHAPASNSQYINQIPEQTLRDVHILNWGMHRDLLAEVSGARWTGKYFEMPSYEIYTTGESLNHEDGIPGEIS